ncbi:MAG: hypothetical protein A2Z14_05430 [Chloroflexi bacterium RBG_16_48_8]|nr:MAG: hypothetical protein A2Z14_05430 [Chloroflexi bacterium RBG_16_48_8]
MKQIKRILILVLLAFLSASLGSCAKNDTTPSGGSSETEGGSTLTGTVDEITPTSWIIGGKTVHVSDDVIIKGTVVVGDEVSAKVSLDENAEYWTSQIELISRGTSEQGEEPTQVIDNSQNLVEFSGTVEMISSDQWAVSGWTVTIEPQTEIKGNPEVGDMVRVHAAQGEDGSLIALEIKPTDDANTGNDNAGKFEFNGTVEAMEGDHWIVDDHTLVVTPKTEIDLDIDLGDEVKVEGIRGDDGTLTAQEIKLLGIN